MGMPTLEHLQALGAEIDRLRVERGIKSIRTLASLAGVSNQHVGHIINATVQPKRGFIIPSDEVLEKLAKTLEVPVSRFHTLLGRFDGEPFPELTVKGALDIAEMYNSLSPCHQKVLTDMAKSLQEADVCLRLHSR